MNKLRERIREPSRADVMYRDNRVLRPQGDTAVNYFLTPSLHLGVASLHRGKVQCFIAFAGIHAGCRTTPEPDQHRRTPQYDQLGPWGNSLLLYVTVTYVAKPAGDHDRLVIAMPTGGIPLIRCHLQGAKIPRDIRPAEFIVEGRGPDRSFEHDLQWWRDPGRALLREFPWHSRIR